MNIDPMEIEDSKNTEAKIQGSGYQQEPIGDHHEVVVGNLLPLVLNDKAYSQTNTPFERRNWRPISGDNAKTRNGIKDICDSGGRRLHVQGRHRRWLLLLWSRLSRPSRVSNLGVKRSALCSSTLRFHLTLNDQTIHRQEHRRARDGEKSYTGTYIHCFGYTRLDKAITGSSSKVPCPVRTAPPWNT